ncbi:hypothetical protein PT974_02200 [Cladobotryum mycophilum]|uniref:Copper transporter n=1 Tax=Cladobotryum mycophilum TaxID=491253 RepID=A0ABR0SYL5_9HYPO
MPAERPLYSRIITPILFIVAILAFVLVDMSNTIRRTCENSHGVRRLMAWLRQLASRRQPYQQAADRDEMRQNWYYHWRIRRIFLLNMADAVYVWIFMLYLLVGVLVLAAWVLWSWLVVWAFGSRKQAAV